MIKPQVIDELVCAPRLMFFTYANAKYHVFATLYPLFALISNPDAVVEIIISDYELFEKNYANIIKFYDEIYPSKVRFTPVTSVEVKNIRPGSVRFLKQPTLKAEYVYIGDVDIFIMESILNYHLDFMARHQSDFSNVLRSKIRLTGLHFISYDKMYPVETPPNTDLLRTNDEVLLCKIMREKNLRFPINATLSERPVHGLHVSYFSRPPLFSITTFDKPSNFPAWTTHNLEEKYLNFRYSEPVKNFTECIKPRQITLRRIIQIADMWALFLKEHPDEKWL